jgi:hypothetical protein
MFSPWRGRICRWMLIYLLAAIPTRLSGGASTKTIDLHSIGYPEPPCDYMFQDSDAYAKRHIEFLDSGHLLVSFPSLQTSDCHNRQLTNQDFRSVVLDLSGNQISSLDWKRTEVFNLQAGPDGDILAITPTGIRLMDRSFRSIQDISLPAIGLAVELAPSRKGFAAIFGQQISAVAKPHTVYFGGQIPLQEEFQANTSNVAIGDGILASIFVEDRTATLNADQRSFSCVKAAWIVIPTTLRPVCLTDNYRLVELREGGGESLIADVHSLAPGRNSGFRYELTDANVGRLLIDSHGARFGISDSWGFGYYRLVGIYDLRAKRQVFRGQFPIDSDVAISPSGTLLAVRDRTRIDIYDIGQQ